MNTGSAEAIKNRSSFLDNIKGLLIFLVVYTHFLYESQFNGVVDLFVDAVYTFHMPAFIFISGYLSKSENSRSVRSIVRLLMCYAVFNTVMVFGFYHSGSINGITPYNSMWYLIALVLWRVSAKYLARVKHIVPLLVGAAFICGLWGDIGNALSLARFVAFSPYFMAGYLFDKEKLQRLASPKTAKSIGIGLLCLVTGAALAVGGAFVFDYTEGDLLMGAYGSLNDIPERALLMVTACLLIAAVLRLMPDKNIPVLTQVGRNSLAVYLCHRPVTLLYTRYFRGSEDTAPIMGLAFAAALLVLIVFGSDAFSRLLDRFIGSLTDLVTGRPAHKLTKAVCAVTAAAVLVLPFVADGRLREFTLPELTSAEEQPDADAAAVDVKHRVLSSAQQAQFDEAFRLVFTGDLILLEDQVRCAYNGSGYDFSELFAHTEKYISSADLAIGVFEGPMGGEELGYSSSNFNDGKELYLNYPDEFGEAVRDAGYDLVTTANNHLLDRGEDAAHRTLDVLDELGLAHTGSYRSAEEKQSGRVKLIEAEGIRFAVLSYTYGTNGLSEDELLNGSMSYITSLLVSPDSESFETVKQQVQADFAAAKQLEPDLIVVLPHMGTQFENEPDEYQLAWCEVFTQCGADIILGDHTHSVQPVMLSEADGRTVFTAYCPGNYTNIYRRNNGDASAMIEVYIDRESKQVTGGGIVPMWTRSSLDGNYQLIPVCDIVSDPELRATISTYDMERVEQVHRHITSVMLGTELTTDLAQQRLLFDKDGFLRAPAEALPLTEELMEAPLYKAMQAAESICFIGDSVTEGTKNGGAPWYEPLLPYFGDKIRGCAWGGGTVQTLIDNIEEINSRADDLYIIAIGTNDVRYRNAESCAMTSQQYTERLSQLCSLIKEKSPDAEFVFIAPWTSTDGDPFCELTYSQKKSLNDEYSDALEALCDEYMYIDPNPYIESYITRYPSSEYLLDHIHPNVTRGIALYCEAVLTASSAAG